MRGVAFRRSTGEARVEVREASLIFSLLFLLSSPCVHSKRGERIGARLFKTCTGKALVK
jgi:hypothetical protein